VPHKKDVQKIDPVGLAAGVAHVAGHLAVGALARIIEIVPLGFAANGGVDRVD
jgi:hypothetical protein